MFLAVLPKLFPSHWFLGLLLILGPLMPGAEAASEDDPPLLGTATMPIVHLYPHESRVLFVPFSFAGPGAFTVANSAVSCRCIQFVTAPTVLLNNLEQQMASVVLGANKDYENSQVSVWLIGSADNKSGYLERIIQFDVRDYVAWPETGDVWNLGNINTSTLPYTKNWQLAHGEHVQPWDRMVLHQETGADYMNAIITPVINSPDYQLTLTIAAENRRFIGPLTTRLRWNFQYQEKDLPYRPERTIRVNFTGDRAASPPALLFSGQVVGNTVTNTCVISTNTHQRLSKIQKITLSHPDEITVLTAIIDEERLQLTITCNSGAQPRIVNGHIDVLFVDNITVRIPYYGRVSELKP